jgi:hypothetical protein
MGPSMKGHGMFHSKARARAYSLVVIPLLALSVAACGSTPNHQESSPGGDTRADSPVTAAQQWRLDFAECMRSHDIDMEDPGSNGEFVASRPSDETPERRAATTACTEELGPAPASSGDEGTGGIRPGLLELARCLREQGLDVEDPAPGSGIAMPEGITDEILEACSVDVTGGVPAE